MVSQDDPHVVVRVDETDQGCPPSHGGRDVQEREDSHLEDYQPEEYHINELYHFCFVIRFLYLCQYTFFLVISIKKLMDYLDQSHLNQFIFVIVWYE